MSDNSIIYVVTKQKQTGNAAPVPMMDPKILKICLYYENALKYFETLEVAYTYSDVTITPTIRTLRFNKDFMCWYDVGETLVGEYNHNPETWVHNDYVVAVDTGNNVFMQPKNLFELGNHVDPNHFMEFCF